MNRKHTAATAKRIKRITAALLGVAMAAALFGCGPAGSPQQPTGTEEAALPQAPAEALQAGIALLPALPGGDEVLGLAALICRCSAEARAAVLRSLKLPRALETQAAQLAALADAPFSVPDTGLYLARMGEDQLRRLLALQRAAGVLSRAEAQQRSCRAADVLAASLPLKANALPVHGEDMKALGLSGPAIGKTLNALHEKVLRDITDFIPSLGWRVNGLDYSPIRGPEGNIEFLMDLVRCDKVTKNSGQYSIDVTISRAYDNFFKSLKEGL